MSEIVGQGKYRYRVHWDWQRAPEHVEVRACAVAVDADDRVYCFNRNKDHPVVIFNPDGSFAGSWGAGLFQFPHAIRFDADDNVWLTDEHYGQFFKFAKDGRLLQTIGERDARSDTGVPNDDYSSTAWKKVTHGGGPFNLPTDIIQAADGAYFMSDGYGNARVHKFSKDLKLIKSWGEPGTGPGQFNLPHGLWIDSRGRLLVADRENDRVQVFDQDGNFLSIWPTTLVGVAFFYVDDEDVVYIPEHNAGMISLVTLDGEPLARWGNEIHKSTHGIWCDSHKNIYAVQPGEWGRIRRIVKYERL